MQYDKTFAQSQITRIKDNEDNHKFKKILVWIIFILIGLVTFKYATALDWHEQKEIAKQIGYKNNYVGDFSFMYYDYHKIDNKTYYAFFKSNSRSHKDSLISFYKPSLNLDKNQFSCLVLHELGHYEEKKHLKFNKEFVWLNETYADDYMQSKNNGCVRFY